MEGAGMTPRSRYSAQIVVSVTPEIRARLEGMADDEGVSLAQIARKLLDTGLDATTAPADDEYQMDPQQLRKAARQLVKTGLAEDFEDALRILRDTPQTSEEPDTI